LRFHFFIAAANSGGMVFYWQKIRAFIGALIMPRPANLFA